MPSAHASLAHHVACPLSARVRRTATLGRVGVDMQADGVLDAVRYLALAMEHHEIMKPPTNDCFL
jgi:hypothetical protein